MHTFTIRRQQLGLSIVELMVGVAIGLAILTGLALIYSQNSKVSANLERNSRHLESGRYAMQALSADLRLAGYLGEYYPNSGAPTLPADPCTTAIANLRNDFLVHVQGYNDSDGGLSCLSDYAGGDVIVIRRAATCTAANPLEDGCDALVDGQPYLQVSGCSTDGLPAYAISRNALAFRLENSSAGLSMKKIGCSTTASARRLHTHIYYIAANNIAGDGIPTLKRWELGASNNPQPIAEGIENLQITYGIDSDANGIADSYSDAPADITDWLSVVSVKFSVTSRSSASSNPRRHQFTSSVALENPAGRRQ